MPKLTKFLGLHNEFFGQEIPIRNNALTRIRITFHGNALSVPEVISFVINIVGGLNCIPFESTFRILVIALISSSMCPSVKTQKDVVDEKTRRFSKCIPWRLE
jgi:hypothetical protein